MGLEFDVTISFKVEFDGDEVDTPSNQVELERRAIRRVRVQAAHMFENLGEYQDMAVTHESIARSVRVD